MDQVQEKKNLKSEQLDVTINIEIERDYLSNRVDSQINWLSERSSQNKKWHYGLRFLTLLFSAAMPLLVSYSYTWVKLLAGTASFGVALTVGTNSLFKFHDNWIRYRTASESLKSEKWRYQTKTAPYDTVGFEHFVDRVETFLQEENSSWALTIQEKIEKECKAKE